MCVEGSFDLYIRVIYFLFLFSEKGEDGQKSSLNALAGWKRTTFCITSGELLTFQIYS